MRKLFILMLVILLTVLSACGSKKEEELKPLNVQSKNFRVMPHQENFYLLIDVEIENPNKEPIKFDYYYRVNTPGGNILSETDLYTGDDACKNIYETDIEGTITCKAVFKVVTSGDYEFRMLKAKFLNSETVATTKFKLDNDLKITFN